MELRPLHSLDGLLKFAGLARSTFYYQQKVLLEEKAQIVMELRPLHSLDGLLKFAGLARSTFYYQQKVLLADDKYAGLKDLIQATFYEHKGRYGYRRITAAR
ncbi:hypothetical protein AO393_24925 [Pseudomonas syringae pv. syringae]|nr:hypothetical protein AO393_24925 [Pseudomonas syringae pv. syringae]